MRTDVQPEQLTAQLDPSRIRCPPTFALTALTQTALKPAKACLSSCLAAATSEELEDMVSSTLRAGSSSCNVAHFWH